MPPNGLSVGQPMWPLCTFAYTATVAQWIRHRPPNVDSLQFHSNEWEKAGDCGFESRRWFRYFSGTDLPKGWLYGQMLHCNPLSMGCQCNAPAASQNPASAGNRTRAARVAGEHSTTEPPMPCNIPFAVSQNFWLASASIALIFSFFKSHFLQI